MASRLLFAVSVSIILATSIFACSGDSPSNVAAPDPDGGGSPTGEGGPAPGEGGTTPPPEPTCAPLAGKVPAWTFKDKAVDEKWTGNPEMDIFGPKLLGLAGVAYGNGMWVAMAASSRTDSMTWATSTDGTTWTSHTQALAGIKLLTARGLVFDGKRWLFIGVHDQVGTFAYVSTDALTWKSNQVSDKGLNVGGLASTGDAAVFVGANGTMYSSHDLVTWGPRDPAAGNGFGYLDLVAGGGRFVTTANVGIGPFVSSDGENWTKVTTAIGQNLSYGRGNFHARTGGNFKKSADGATWSDDPQSGTSFAVMDGGKSHFGGGRFIQQQVEFGKGSSKFGASLDGATWTEFGEEPNGLGAPAGRGVFPAEVVYGGCHYIAYGNYHKTDATVVAYMIVTTAPPAP